VSEDDEKKGPGRPIEYHDNQHKRIRLAVRESRSRKQERVKQLIHTLADLFLQIKRKARTRHRLEFGNQAPITLKAVPAFEMPEMYEQIARSLHRIHNDFPLVTVRLEVKGGMEEFKRHEDPSKLEGFEKELKEILLTEDYLILQLKIRHAREELKRQFEAISKKTEANETALGDLWVNCMKYLEQKGYEYYPAKRASDRYVFFGTFRQPYQYYGEHMILKTAYDPLWLYHGDLREWYNRDRTQALRDYEIEEIFVKRDEERDARREEMRPKLIKWILSGRSDEEIKLELMKTYGPTSKWISEGMSLTKALRVDHKPKHQIIKMKVVDEQDTQQGDAAFTANFDETVMALIQYGLTDEEIVHRLQSDPELSGISGPHIDLWKGRIRQLRSQTQTGVSSEPEKASERTGH